jgi:hypothetical protein
MSARGIYRPVRRLLLPLIAVFISTSATAAESNDNRCSEEIYAAVKRFIKVDSLLPRKQGGTVVAEACKLWPYDKRRYLAAIAYDKGVENEKSLVVIVLDRRTLDVVAGYQSVVNEDAITEVGRGSLQLDTAKYQLSHEVRAFGLHFTSTARGPGCADGMDWDYLTLFIEEKNRLRPVFQQPMQFQEALQGCIGGATGHDVWEYGRRAISVADTRSNGFSDLLITETIAVDGNVEPTPTETRSKKKSRSFLMKYDGNEYRSTRTN